MLHPANRIIIRYGEIGLKGRNRPIFEEKLRKNVEQRLSCAGMAWPVRNMHDGLYVEVPEEAQSALPEASACLREVAGIVYFALAWWLPAAHAGEWSSADLVRIEKAAVELAQPHQIPGATFCVRVRRTDKHFPVSSTEMEKHLGAAIIQSSGWDKVKLQDPDRTFHLDINRAGAFLYTEKTPGVGGLPVGSSGRVISLLSGGIDSPVASYLMAKRGCTVDFLHVTATDVQQQSAEQGVVAELARQLSRYTLRSRLYVLPSDRFDMALMGRETGYEPILFRRFTGRLAQALARRSGAQALVTGDSLGQVTSQTLENMVTISAAVELPIFRPLISSDKQEIIALAHKIGSYQTSIQPYKDCCALLCQTPRTKSAPHRVEKLEQELMPDYQGLIDATLAEMVCLEYECGVKV